MSCARAGAGPMILGVLGGGGRADVDARGALTVVGEAWTLDWWIGADDRWRVPAREPAVRQLPLDGAPVAETRLRIPSGDAVQRVYGIGGRGDVVIVEVENDSPGACIVAFAVRGATSVALDGSTLMIDGRAALVLPFPPRRWDVTDVELEAEQCGAQTGVIEPCELAPGTLRVALLYPLSHRNRMRIGVICGDERPRIDLAQVPAPPRPHAGVATTPRRRDAGDRPRRAGRGARPRPVAGAARPRPERGDRRGARGLGLRRAGRMGVGGAVGPGAAAARRRTEVADDPGPAGRLVRARAGLVRDVDAGIEILGEPPAAGSTSRCTTRPTRHGRLSFALRWHGEHPALLWELTPPDRTPVEAGDAHRHRRSRRAGPPTGAGGRDAAPPPATA